MSKRFRLDNDQLQSTESDSNRKLSGNQLHKDSSESFSKNSGISGKPHFNNMNSDEESDQSSEEDEFIRLAREEKLSRKIHKSSNDKQINFLNPEDVEGQEIVESELLEHEVAIEPFNLHTEFQEGKFDDAGNYIRNEDHEKIEDNWLEGVSRQDIIKAKDAQEKQRKTEQYKEHLEDQRQSQYEKDLSGLIKRLLSHLLPTENVVKALKRLAPPKKLKHVTEEVSSNTEDNMKSFNELTEVADIIMNRFGLLNIFETSYEELQSNIDKKNMKIKKLSSDPVKSSSGSSKRKAPIAEWVYKWNENGEEYGPFSTSFMANWEEQGFFNDGVFVRSADELDAPFCSSKLYSFAKLASTQH